jgi:hypothetical protein
MTRATPPHPLERILVFAGLAACLGITPLIFLAIGRVQPMWPLPGLYLLEMLLLSAAAAYAVVREVRPAAAVLGAVLGAMGAFAVLAAWSIGAYYLPVLFLLGAGGAAALLRRRAALWPALVSGLAAAIVQAGLILAVVRILYA